MTDHESDIRQFVTFTIGGQLCGIPVLQVRNVLAPQEITPIPLAPPEIAGSLNLRGRIVTSVDLRVRLGLPTGDVGQDRMSDSVGHHDDPYSLIIRFRRRGPGPVIGDTGADSGDVGHLMEPFLERHLSDRRWPAARIGYRQRSRYRRRRRRGMNSVAPRPVDAAQARRIWRSFMIS